MRLAKRALRFEPVYSPLRFLVVLWSFAAALPLCAAEPAATLVAVARDRGAIIDYAADRDAVQAMVDGLVKTVTGKSDIAAAWGSLVSPTDKIGIKVSTDGGRYFSTHLSVVDAIVRGMRRAGIPVGKITVWDRDQAKLRAAGFLPADRGYAVRWADPATGYDAQAEVTAAILGKLIWGDLKFVKKTPRNPWDDPYDPQQLSSTSHLCAVLSREVTKVINVPVLSESTEVGVAGCIYNMTVRNVDNWRRFTQPPELGDPDLAEMYQDKRIGGKVVLNIMDGLIAQYASGPGFEPLYAVHYHTLLASRDPVALDATAVRLIDEWRSKAKLPAAEPRAGYVRSAGVLGLGRYNPDQIELRAAGTQGRDGVALISSQ